MLQESYLARHSPRQTTKEAHIAVTAIKFAVKLKRNSDKRKSDDSTSPTKDNTKDYRLALAPVDLS
eukprot:3972105-Prymnesium_polylepis.1